MSIRLLTPTGDEAPSKYGFAGTDRPTLEQAQQAVGGYVQLVESPDGDTQMIINDQGKLDKLPANALATDLAYSKQMICSDDWIAGTVLILTGESRWLPDEDEDEAMI